jgi:hypothetical protein
LPFGKAEIAFADLWNYRMITSLPPERANPRRKMESQIQAALMGTALSIWQE